MKYTPLILILLVGCLEPKQTAERATDQEQGNTTGQQLKRLVDVVAKTIDHVETKTTTYSHDVWIDRMKVVGLFVWSIIVSWVLAKKHGYWIQRAKRLANGKDEPPKEPS